MSWMPRRPTDSRATATKGTRYDAIRAVHGRADGVARCSALVASLPWKYERLHAHDARNGLPAPASLLSVSIHGSR
jgi:hypothetical protein